ncbi:MAG: UDP-N-acetylmuramoyl-tripeptide--D-alanyl-D-alanine ligase [Marinilabiliales bacterium]|nr:MAG: UDP-N-acetylmuramoyl-tripeptide--D-alanyl-D-alanine ligase [Marinilabiliales bacterium]
MDLEGIYHIWEKSTGISTDSRSVKKGNLFFSLSGDNFNGNKFATQAIEKGAIAAIIDDPDYKTDDNYILVDDSLDYLQQLSKLHREKLKTPILAITGSNGKTTTKELISSVLSSQKKISYTKGNLNNHIGVPLSLMEIQPDTEIAIIEMGANHIGEIKFLCDIATPDFGIITNIGKAHLEGFGNYEGVVKAKSELYSAIKQNKGEVFLNRDDDLLVDLSDGIKSFTYGINEDADIKGEIIKTNPSLEIKWYKNDEANIIQTNLYGKYNFPNIMAAIACGIYFGISSTSISSAIANYIPDNNRSQLIKAANNTILMDAYNANPVSMSGAINSFVDFHSEEPVLILGDMFELGKESTQEHEKIIEQLQGTNFNEVFLVGKEFCKFADKEKFLFFETTENLKSYLDVNPLKNKTILIKGSRGMKLEMLMEKF